MPSTARWRGAAAHWSDPCPFLTKTSFDPLGRDQSSSRLPALSNLLNRYDMNGRSQMQGGKNWILPKELIAIRFFWDSHWLETWKSHLCPSMDRMEGAWLWILTHVSFDKNQFWPSSSKLRALYQISCFCTKLCRSGIAAYWHAVAEDRPDAAVQCQVLPYGGCLPRGPGKYLIKRLFLQLLSLFVMVKKKFVDIKKSVN